MSRFIALAFAFAISSSVFAQKTYVSNALGMEVRAISASEADDHEYVLRIIEGAGKTTKLLLENGRERKRWEMLYQNGDISQETVHEDGRLVEKRLYTEGRIASELYYRAEIIDERREYSYLDGILREVSAFDADGKEIYRDIYERSKGGRLRSIRRVSQGEDNLSSFTYSDGRLVGEWHAKDDEGILFRYHDNEGLSKETWEGLKLVLSEEVRQHQGKVEIVMQDASLGIKTTQYLDTQERVQIVRTESETDLVEHISYGYEQENITEKTRITRDAKEEWEYEYDEEGNLVKETLMRNSRLIKTVTHVDEDTYYEEIYRDGALALRVHFENGIKVSEEFIRAPEETR